MTRPRSIEDCRGKLIHEFMAIPSQDEDMPSSISDDLIDGPGDNDAPSNAVSVLTQKKEPPPETSESIRTRSLVILSFWVIVLFLGLPIWWRTTAIYRAKLPLNQMMDWADGRVSWCPPSTSFLTHQSGMSTSISITNINRSRFAATIRSTTSS